MGTAPDGSPVEVYERLPELGEGDIFASAIAAGATVLELGCGVGLVNAEPEQRRAFLETCRRHSDVLHAFGMCVFADEAELGEALADAGLQLERKLDERWFVAVPSS